MLTFYYNQGNSFTEWVSDKMEEMVVAHNMIDSPGSTELPNGLSATDLPVLTDGHESWKTEGEIKSFLNQLHGDLKLSTSLQSDACHIDPDSSGECL